MSYKSALGRTLCPTEGVLGAEMGCGEWVVDLSGTHVLRKGLLIDAECGGLVQGGAAGRELGKGS